MVLIFGAGMMGKAIAHDLMTNNVEVRICDIKKIQIPNFFTLDASDVDAVTKEMKKEDLVINALPYDFNYILSKIALKTKTDYIDLGGNTYISKKQLQLDNEAKKTGITIISDSGLAPGMTNILAYHLWQNGIKDINIRVGGLPQKPIPPLNYALFFSIRGLINEYLEDSIVVENGQVKTKQSLTGLEDIKFVGFPKLEAFYTHGGISNLPNTLSGINTLEYKTIRYKGHADYFIMLKQLGFFTDHARNFTESILRTALSTDTKDVVLARIYGGDIQMEMVDYYDNIHNVTAMARTTGFPTAIIAKMILNGTLSNGAYSPEEIVDYHKFIDELKKRNIIWRIK
jgi:lysine 6-dehydrogenase